MEGSREVDSPQLHWHGLPRLDPKVDVPAVQFVGYQTSQEQIGDLFHQVYMLKRLPGSPLCRPKCVWEVTRDILSSLKDHLQQRRGEQSEGSGELEPTSTCLSQHQDRASQRERQDTSGQQELAEAGDAHQQALATTSILQEWIERLSQSTTRMRPDLCHHSQSQEEGPKGRAKGAIGPCLCKAAKPSPLHIVHLAHINGSPSCTQNQHLKKTKQLDSPPPVLIWGWISSPSCRSWPPCKRRVRGVISHKSPQQKSAKSGLSGGDVRSTHLTVHGS